MPDFFEYCKAYPMQTHNLDRLIIGGGPAGLAAVVSLAVIAATFSFSTAAKAEPSSYPKVTTIPAEAQMEDAMDTEKTEQEKKPIIDQMTDLAAEAAGTLAETAVKAIAKRAKKAVTKSGPTPVRKAAKTVAKAAKAPKKTAKKAAKKPVRKAVKKAKGSKKVGKEKDGEEMGR
jgi:hypothetical protein